MKRFLILNFVIFAIAAMPVVAGDTTSYGDGVTLAEAVAIDTLIANPDDYIGRTVRVDGVITDHPALARQVIKDRAELSSAERLMLTAAFWMGLEPKEPPPEVDAG